jgi:hypothetical protein
MAGELTSAADHDTRRGNFDDFKGYGLPGILLQQPMRHPRE